MNLFILFLTFCETVIFFQVNQSANFSMTCSDPLLDSSLVKAVKSIAYSTVLVASLIGNLLIVTITYRNRELRKSINLFILNLSVTHLFLPLFTQTVNIKRIYVPREDWLVGGAFGEVTCKFVTFAADLSLIVSIFTLEIIAIERFSSIVLPLQRKQATRKKTCYIIIALMWIIGALYPSLNFYKYKLVYKGNKPFCTRSWEPIVSNEEAFKVEAPVLLVLFTVFPFVLFTFLYSAIAISLHCQKRHLQLASGERKRREKENRHVTNMLATVVAMFLLSWIPFNVYWVLRAYFVNFDTWCNSRHIRFSATFLMNLYPAVNPLVYFVFSHNYRKGLREILCCSLTRTFVHTQTPNLQQTIKQRSTGGNVVLLSKRSLDI